MYSKPQMSFCPFPLEQPKARPDGLAARRSLSNPADHPGILC
jgi:hypothetical protein